MKLGHAGALRGILACSLLLALASCGGSADLASPAAPVTVDAADQADQAETPQPQSAEPQSAEPQSAEPQAAGPLTTLPDVEVVRVASGAKANLRTLAVPGKPTLLWFWAPHCPICKAEAPELVAFAREHGDDIQVLGLGAQDDLKLAGEFLGETKTGDLEMVWDRTGKTWLHYKVTNQPTVVVLGPDGEPRRTWFRKFDAKGILAAAGLGAAGR